MLKKLSFFLSVLVALASLGCGGQLASDSPTRGEGDIPVGRVRIAPGRSAMVRIDSSSGSYSTEVNPSGVVMAPSLAPGTVTFTIEPTSNELMASSFQVEVATSQQYLFNAEVQSKNSGITVDTLQIELVGSPVNVGQSRSIKVILNGKNAGNIRPTLWIDGGVGMLDVGNRFVATSPGEGVIHAELLGVHTSIPVSVAP